MTVEKIIDLQRCDDSTDGIVDEHTEIIIRTVKGCELARGNWYEEKILAHADDEVRMFSWDEDNRVDIYVKRPGKSF